MDTDDLINFVNTILADVLDDKTRKKWIKVIKSEMKDVDKIIERHKIGSLVAAFAIGYLLGSLKRR